MPPSFPQVYLARHGETEWSLNGRHTGLTDVPLTERGQQNARQLGPRLAGTSFAQVLTSPLQRASQTCTLAGFAAQAVPEPDLVEWNYGAFEGITTPEIQKERPGWEIFKDGCPDGETVADVAVRANRVVERIRNIEGDVLLFSHAHFLHVFAACWLGLEPEEGRYFYLGTAALSILGYYHDLDDPVIRLWNDCSHQSK